MKTTLLVSIALLWCSTTVSSATLEFSAYIQSGAAPRFVITDVEEKTSSGWIAIGQSFKGHTLVAFDQKREVLSVKKEEATLELRLKESRVQDVGAPEIRAKLSDARKEYMNLLMHYTPKHPRVAAQLKIINELEGRLRK
jgi:hypothetical protein